ncbi:MULTISPECIES: maleylpyruvate isomerase family mycothiol-dependent enzyme [unclassified Streptomyces]|uniref:Maleylpyruvate isomerase family mycothiol-dependent enzyme n=1 Tax=Streptomyces sp. NBC_00060 TaxID=2975636 RepID=A0AAU2HA95_9ACTN
MDYVAQFRREIHAFDTAIRTASLDAGSGGVALVPSCPGWSVADLVFHLGSVHRYVADVISEKRQQQPEAADLSYLNLPPVPANWPLPENAPHRGPVPPGLIDWFGEGAAALGELLATRDAAEPVWTWSREQSVGFWQRMQTIEAAVHRWDAENAIGVPGPVERQLAMDAVTHTFEVMAPARRARRQAPPGAGERLRFRQSDGSRIWIVQTDPDEVLLNAGSGCCDVELTATASDLMLFLWHRIPLDGLEVRGDASLLDRYFKLVPPL